jgi:hypothetical protein
MSLSVAEAIFEALLKVATDQHFFRVYSSGEDRGGALDLETSHTEKPRLSTVVRSHYLFIFNQSLDFIFTSNGTPCLRLIRVNLRPLPFATPQRLHGPAC